MESLDAAGIYIVRTLFGIYIWMVLVRFLLQLARADFYNPISQSIVKITNPALAPFRRVMPRLFGIDISAFILAMALQLIMIYLIFILYGQMGPNIILAVGWSLVGLLSMTLNIYFFALLIMIVLSWVAPHSNHPGSLLVLQITEPIMAPVRKILPSFGGLDLSPIVIFIAINLMETVVVRQLAVALSLPRQLIMGL